MVYNIEASQKSSLLVNRKMGRLQWYNRAIIEPIKFSVAVRNTLGDSEGLDSLALSIFYLLFKSSLCMIVD